MRNVGPDIQYPAYSVKGHRGCTVVRQRVGSSERCTCQVLDQRRSTQRYASRQEVEDEDALRLAIMRLAKQYGRYGYRKIAPHSCGSKAGTSISRKSSACGAKKACRSPDATKHANDYMTTNTPSSGCVPCIRTLSGVWTLFRTGCFGASIQDAHCH